MTPSWREMIRTYGRIGLMSFGGPVAQIGVMHRELVEGRGWLSDEAFTRGLSFSMLLPGPEAMQLATWAGWRQRGVGGGLLAGGLFVLPGALFMALITAAYLNWGTAPGVEAAFLGIKAAVIVVVAQALLRLGRKVLTGPLQMALAAGAFGALALALLPFPAVVVMAAIIGAVTAKETGHGPADPGDWGHTARHGVLWLALWLAPLGVLAATGPERLFEIAGFFTRLAAFSFGGAYALLAWMSQALVEDQGWLTAAQMVDGLGLAETTPGPLVLVTQYAGMLAAEPLGGTGIAAAALLTLWAIFVPCFGLVFTLAPHMERLSQAPRLSAALKAVSASVVGVIGALALFFARHTLVPEGSVSLAALGLTLLAALLLVWRALPLPLVLALLAAAGFGLHMVTG